MLSKIERGFDSSNIRNLIYVMLFNVTQNITWCRTPDQELQPDGSYKPQNMFVNVTALNAIWSGLGATFNAGGLIGAMSTAFLVDKIGRLVDCLCS